MQAPILRAFRRQSRRSYARSFRHCRFPMAARTTRGWAGVMMATFKRWHQVGTCHRVGVRSVRRARNLSNVRFERHQSFTGFVANGSNQSGAGLSPQRMPGGDPMTVHTPTALRSTSSVGCVTEVRQIEPAHRPRLAPSVQRRSWARTLTVVVIEFTKSSGTGWARSGHRMGTKQNAVHRDGACQFVSCCFCY
jgi:hypothetical protein